MVGARRLLLLLAIAACRPGVAPSIVPPGDGCVIAGLSAAPDTVRVGVTGGVNPGYALHQRTRAESIVVAHVHETLVRVSCEDRIVPALAERWETRDGGRSWSFDLRPDATFSDGTPVTGQSVVEAWRERQSAAGPRPDERAAAVASLTIESERRITVHFRDPQSEGPRLLADPFYAIHRRGASSGSAIGSGGFIIPAVAGGNTAGAAVTIAQLVPREPGTAPVLLLTTARSGDERDLIDAGVDLMASSDQRVLEYATTRSDLRVTALPADRAYMLLATDRALSGGTVPTSSDDPRWDALRASLARDVIRGPMADRTWWGAPDRVSSCAPAAPSVAARWPLRGASVGRRIVHPSSDRVAGDLARRLVAIAAQGRESARRAQLAALLPELVEGDRGALVAVGLTVGEMSASLAQGNDAAYIVAMPLRALDRCVAWRELVTRAPWIDPGVPVPLAHAGSSLVSSARAPAVTIDWDNSLRIGSPASGARGPR